MPTFNVKLPKGLLPSLRTYFQTVNVTTFKGTKLTIISDGRAGDGFTHWREVRIGKRLVADLSDVTGWGRVTLAKRGNLRTGDTHEFASLADATKFLLVTL